MPDPVKDLRGRRISNPFSIEEQQAQEKQLLDALPDIAEVKKEADNRVAIIHESGENKPVNVRLKKVLIIRDTDGSRIERNYREDDATHRKAVQKSERRKAIAASKHSVNPEEMSEFE